MLLQSDKSQETTKDPICQRQILAVWILAGQPFLRTTPSPLLGAPPLFLGRTPQGSYSPRGRSRHLLETVKLPYDPLGVRSAGSSAGGTARGLPGLKARAASRQPPPAVPGQSPRHYSRHSSQHPDFPRQSAQQSPQQFWGNGPPDGFFRGFRRRIFSPLFCGKKCPENSSRKIPSNILQNLFNKNPRHIFAEAPLRESETTIKIKFAFFRGGVGRGAERKIVQNAFFRGKRHDNKILKVKIFRERGNRALVSVF